MRLDRGDSGDYLQGELHRRLLVMRWGYHSEVFQLFYNLWDHVRMDGGDGIGVERRRIAQ